MKATSVVAGIVSLLSLGVSLAVGAFVVLRYPADWQVARSEGDRAASEIERAARAETRVQFPVNPGPESVYRNHMISLSHNWRWDEDAGWVRPDRTQPSVALTLESYFRGLAELNLDMGAPGPNPPWRGGRAMGFAARYDGSYSTLSIAGPMFSPDGAGLKLTGGTTGEPVVLVTPGTQAREPTIEIRGLDGAAGARLGGGETPALELAGRDGVLVMRGDGRLSWREAGGAAGATLAMERAGVRISGAAVASSLRLGEDGAALTGVVLHALDLAPGAVPPGAVVEHVVTLPGAGPNAAMLVNGPAQPPGVALAGIRAVGADAAALTFVNLGAQAREPGAGRYLVMIMQAEPQ